MAGSRDERFLMRQRGAGTRNINLTFDLQLPSIPPVSRSPLKPQISTRSNRNFQSGASTLPPTRQSPRISKATPKLVPRHHPATSQKKTPKVAEDENGSSREEPALDAHGTKTTLQDQKGVRPRRPKVGPAPLVDVSEPSEMAPAKRPKKRKPIGQDSLRKKSHGPVKKITKLRKPSSRSGEVQLVRTEPLRAITRRLSNTTRDVSASTRPISDDDVVDQRTKGGRNQKAGVNESIQPEKAVMRSEATYSGFEAPQENSPALAEFGSQPSEAPTAPNRKSRKRKPFGQMQRPRKRVATKAPENLSLDPSPADGNITPSERTAAAPNFPKRRDKILSRNLQKAPPPIEDAKEEAPHEFSEQVRVPKKRGRPRKPSNPCGQNEPNTVEMAGDDEGIENGHKTRGRLKEKVVLAVKPDPAKVIHDPMTQTEGDIGSKKRSSNKTIKVHQSVTSDRLPRDQGAVTASPGPAAPSLHPNKKRGRPRRQVLELPAVKPTISCPLPEVPEANTVSLESMVLSPPPAKKRGRPRRQVSEIPAVRPTVSCPLPEVPVANTVSLESMVLSPPPAKKRGRPKKQVAESLAAPTAAEKTSIAKRPMVKSKAGPIPAKPSATRNPKTRARPPTTLNLQDDDDDDDDPLSESTTFQPIRKPMPNRLKRPLQAREEPSFEPSRMLYTHPRDHDIMDDAPPLTIEPHTQKDHAPKTAASDDEEQSDNHTLPLTDLDAHIERSLLEEAALKQDLKDLHEQQAQEFAETQQEWDRAFQRRLETTLPPAKAKEKSRTDNNDDLTKWNNNGHENAVLGVKKKKNTRGPGSLFRSVAAKRRVLGGEDIDPDLQGMLDQVKGVGGW
ncbi:MAG: hypothetical protein Q9182_004536 [Xanthomendoza sp. 2 TL-2023]